MKSRIFSAEEIGKVWDSLSSSDNTIIDGQAEETAGILEALRENPEVHQRILSCGRIMFFQLMKKGCPPEQVPQFIATTLFCQGMYLAFKIMEIRAAANNNVENNTRT